MKKIKKYYKKLTRNRSLAGNGLVVGLALVGAAMLAVMISAQSKLDYRTLAQSAYCGVSCSSGQTCVPDTDGGYCTASMIG